MEAAAGCKEKRQQMQQMMGLQSLLQLAREKAPTHTHPNKSKAIETNR